MNGVLKGSLGSSVMAGETEMRLITCMIKAIKVAPPVIIPNHAKALCHQILSFGSEARDRDIAC